MSLVLRKVDSSFCATEVDGELVMIHSGTGKSFSLKGVGLEIWNALDRQANLEAISADLVQEYGISAEECAAAVEGFASQLVAAGFAEFV